MELMDIIKGRRSVRGFSDEKVPDDVINKMVEAAKWAPSASNLQNNEYIVIKSDSVKAKMVEAVKQAMEELEKMIPDGDTALYIRNYGKFFSFFDAAPVVIAVAYKMKRSWVNTVSGSEVAQDDNLSEISSAAASVQNMILMAHSLGYGTCWMTGPLVAEKKIHEILELKGNYKIAAIIPVGKQAGKTFMPDRKDNSIIMKVVE